MGGGNSVVIIKTLAWFLVLQVVSTTGNAAATKEVAFTIQIKNEMKGVKMPSVVYHCWSSKKDYGWRRSVPRSSFSWDFTVPPYGTGVVIHRCEFRSRQLGTMNVKIMTVSMTATLCGGQLCTYVLRRDGIHFIGYEIYYPMGRLFEMVRPLEVLAVTWMPWSPQQLDKLRRSTRTSINHGGGGNQTTTKGQSKVLCDHGHHK